MSDSERVHKLALFLARVIEKEENKGAHIVLFFPESKDEAPISDDVTVFRYRALDLTSDLQFSNNGAVAHWIAADQREPYTEHLRERTASQLGSAVAWHVYGMKTK